MCKVELGGRLGNLLFFLEVKVVRTRYMIAYATASDDYNGNIRGKRDTVTCNSILILKKIISRALGSGVPESRTLGAVSTLCSSRNGSQMS